MGNVSGALGTAEVLGAPGAISGGFARGAGAVAARSAYAGAENVVAATTKDINESSLGDTRLNSQKLYASIPKHFAIGAGLGLAGEGVAAATEAGVAALARKGTPALERGASRALGHEVGLTGEEAEAAGARIRDINKGQVPSGPSDLARILEAEQKSLRGKAVASHAERVAELEGSHVAERSALAERQARDAAYEANSGRMAVQNAEGEAAAGFGARSEAISAREAAVGEAHAANLKAAEAEGERGVQAAKLAGEKGVDEAHEKAFDKVLTQFDKEAVATGTPYRQAVANARQEFESVFSHYEGLRNQVAREREIATANVERLGAQRDALREQYRDLLEFANTPKERGAALFHEKVGKHLDEKHITPWVDPRDQGAMFAHVFGPGSQVEAAAVRDATSASAGRAAIRNARATGQLRTLHAQEFGEGQLAASSVSAAQQLERVKALGQDITKAYNESVAHLEGVKSAQLALEKKAEQEIASAANRAHGAMDTYRRTTSKEALGAAKAADVAMGKVRVAEEDMAIAIDKARAAAAAKIESARATGTKAAEAARKAALKETAAAEKAAQRKVDFARAEAAAAKERYQKTLVQEMHNLEKGQKANLKKLGKPSEETTVDDLLAGARERAKANELRPAVSGAAMVGAGLSLAHGNPGAALVSLGTSFVAGRMRAHGNFVAASAMLGLSKRLSMVDQAIKSGAARLVTNVGAKAGASGERQVEAAMKRPNFEDVADQVRAAQMNPQLVENSVREALGPDADHAPDTYAATLLTAQLAQQYLANILPPPPIDKRTLTPHLQKADIDPTTQDEFMQSWEAIANPTDLYRQALTGEITEQKVAAAQAVVPDLLGQMRQEIGMEIANLKSPLPYDREIYIGMLLGLDTNEVLDRDFQTAQAAAFDDKSAGGSPVGSKPNSGETKVTKNMQSTSEKVERGEP